MSLKKIFWGIYFLLAGTIIILSQTGYLNQINLWSILWVILLIPIMIMSIRHLNFAGILFPLAIIGIIYAKPLGITELTPWPILLVALLFSIGLTILFHKSHHHHEEHFATIVNEPDAHMIDVKVKFSSSIKYVNSAQFEKGIFRCSFGALKVYFDNTTISPNGAEIILDISFAGVELYIPKEWNVVNKVNTSMGGIEEKNGNQPSSGPTVILSGNVSLSGVEIIYI